jgi:hypothetical protein
LRLHASRESAGRFSYGEDEWAVSSVVEHRPYKPRVAGSKPAPPTNALGLNAAICRSSKSDDIHGL